VIEFLLAYTDVRLACTYKDLTNYPKALHLYSEAAEIGGRIKYDLVQSNGFQNLGAVYLAMGKIDSALMYEQEDYELCTRIKFFDYFGYTLLTLGVIHSKMGNAALTISYFDMAIQEGLKTKSPKQLSWAYKLTINGGEYRRRTFS
jgi:tetratricopeptide (TPR) repeat protein